jgi:hypothetical protein
MPIMMRSLVCSTAFIAIATFALTGCPKKGDANGDAGDAAVAVIDAGAPVKIANEADVKRYPTDETALDGDATVLAPTAAARTAAPGGAIVATLKQGTTVTQLVEHNGNYLVTFDDPKDATRRLEGWVGKGVFLPPKAITKLPAKIPNCANGEILSIGDDGLKCRKNCSEDTDCPAGNKCEGLSPADPKGNIIPFQTLLVCAPVAAPVVAKDGGAPTPTTKPDAGSGMPMLPPRFDAGH